MKLSLMNKVGKRLIFFSAFKRFLDTKMAMSLNTQNRFLSLVNMSSSMSSMPENLILV